MAPHNCYRCLGDTGWVTIAVGSEDEWLALKREIADPALEEEGFADPTERWRKQERLDAIVERWTSERAADDVVKTLQAAGVASMRVNNGAKIALDAHTQERGVMQKVEHPVVGERLVVGGPWRFGGNGAGIRRAAPLLGEHTSYVLGEILGMSDEEIEELSRAGVLN